MDEPSLFAVMFADVSGSTALYDEHGDVAASSAIAEALERMSRAVGWHNGVVIKTIGDEVMARFPNAASASLSAVAIQESMGAPTRSGHLLSVRIGIHYGPALLAADGDIFGDAVNIAARMTKIARAGQIIMSGVAVANLPHPQPVKVRLLDLASVKGKREPLEVFQVLWEAEANVTRLVDLGGLDSSGPPGALNLMFQGYVVQLRPEMPTFVIGRDETSDLQVDAPLVSRRHARIEYRRGRFVLEDESTNGTFVLSQRGEKVRLHREELPLLGSGSIGLGQPVSGDDPNVIAYTQINP